MTALVVTGDVEACLQRLKWRPRQSSWRHCHFSVDVGPMLQCVQFGTFCDYFRDILKIQMYCVAAGLSAWYPQISYSAAHKLISATLLMRESPQYLFIIIGLLCKEYPALVDSLHRVSVRPTWVILIIGRQTVYCSLSQILVDVDGLVQERRNSSALGMELHLSCTNTSFTVKYLFDSIRHWLSEVSLFVKIYAFRYVSRWS